jgi:hypothetical protein
MSRPLQPAVGSASSEREQRRGTYRCPPTPRNLRRLCVTLLTFRGATLSLNTRSPLHHACWGKSGRGRSTVVGGCRVVHPSGYSPDRRATLPLEQRDAESSDIVGGNGMRTGLRQLDSDWITDRIIGGAIDVHRYLGPVRVRYRTERRPALQFQCRRPCSRRLEARPQNGSNVGGRTVVLRLLANLRRLRVTLLTFRGATLSLNTRSPLHHACWGKSGQGRSTVVGGCRVVHPSGYSPDRRATLPLEQRDAESSDIVGGNGMRTGLRQLDSDWITDRIIGGAVDVHRYLGPVRVRYLD